MKIIAISGGSGKDPEGYLNVAEKSGAAITLEKPVSSRNLLDAVSRLMGGQG